MEFSIEADEASRRINFKGSVEMSEVAQLSMDRMDTALLDDCGKSGKASDLLLALELLFRRHEEQQK